MSFVNVHFSSAHYITHELITINSTYKSTKYYNCNIYYHFNYNSFHIILWFPLNQLIIHYYVLILFIIYFLCFKALYIKYIRCTILTTILKLTRIIIIRINAIITLFIPLNTISLAPTKTILTIKFIFILTGIFIIETFEFLSE